MTLSPVSPGPVLGALTETADDCGFPICEGVSPQPYGKAVTGYLSGSGGTGRDRFRPRCSKA